jgi:DNA-binding CsgD family transcriptional regulator
VSASLVGRDRELAAIAQFLDDIPRGFAALVLAGPAGIGKTTLWEMAVASAQERGYRVSIARPTEVETSLAFAGLTDLFTDIDDDELAALPEPQRVALRAALLRAPVAIAPEPLAVSLAVGQSLRQATAVGPVVLAIDDAPWLDEATARVLDFVLRRLDTEPLGVIAGQRTEAGDEALPLFRGVAPERVTRVEVGRLTLDGVDRLLRSRIDLELPRPALVRLHGASGGNPFYALELGRAIGDGDSNGHSDVLAVPPSLERLVGRRLDALGPAAERVALHVAAASQASARMLDDAIGSATAKQGLSDAIDAGVLALDADHVRFTHPLLAAAAYGRAAADDRRAAHARLAEVATEPEERAIHLARATSQPDELVADALETAALAVRGRGASEAAAGLAERAAELTPGSDGPARRRRWGLAAQQQIVAGDIDRATVLLDRLVAEADGPGERAEALARMAHLLLVQGRWDEARRLYEDAAGIVDKEPRRRIAIALGLAALAYLTWRDWPAGAGHAAEALRLAEELGDEVVLFQTLGHAASWRAVLGEEWRSLMERADGLAPATAGIPAVEHPDLQFIRLLRDAGEFDEALSRADRLTEGARARGDWHGVPRLLLAKVGILLRLGEVESAEDVLEEAKTGVLQTGEGAWMDELNIQAQAICVLRGDAEGARAVEERVSERLRINPALAYERWTTTVAAADLDLALGDAAGAYRRLEPLLASADDDPLRPTSGCVLVTTGIDVLVALGRIDEAAALYDRWAPRFAGSGIRWVEAETARSEAVVAAARGDIDAAVAASDRSLELARGTRMPLVLGRSLVTAGEVRRRARQKGRARDALEEAAGIFARLGARLWSERARSQLARVAHRRAPGAPLTATERQLVELVAEGRTNREIADTLFMSVHTVEAHLTRLYRALEVHTRTELARLVHEGTDPRLAVAQE